MVPILTALVSLARTAHLDVPLLVVFGRPGAGKSVVADGVFEKIEEESNGILGKNHKLVCIDLDVCVPQWMRDNFANGIYPTLEERQEFALSACDYVERCIEKEKERFNPGKVATIISFSFVNTHLRDTFRGYFPQTKWVLMDTNEGEAKRRIDMREGHFYKGKVSKNDESKPSSSEEVETEKLDTDNSDWAFAPVSFPHEVLDGNSPIETNVQKVSSILEKLLELD